MRQESDVQDRMAEKAKRDRSNKRLGLIVFIVMIVAYFLIPDQNETTSAPQEQIAAIELPAYRILHEEKLADIKLSLDMELAKPVDEATLRALGEKVYKDNKGSSYKNVFIMWYLPHYKVGAGAWGITNFTGTTPQVSIMALQG